MYMTTENILSLINSETFQGLKSYYDETTLFNVIGAERSENRHSAFLRWFFSPDSSHGLGDKPLRLFLCLLATLKWGQQTFKEELYNKMIAGNYELDLLEPVETEKYVGKIKANTKNSKERIDLWMVVRLTYEIDGEQKTHAFPIVIENKIYAKEGVEQTTRYYAAMNEYCAGKGADYSPIGVLLSPDTTTEAACGQFVNLTYQQLLTYVLEPALAISMSPADKAYLTAFIRNLGRPTDTANRDFSVLAISKQESCLTSSLYDDHKDLFNQALVATFPGNVVRDILGKDEYKRIEDSIDKESSKLLSEVWNGNEEIFKAVIYQHYTDKKRELGKLFKGNNRDTSKYKVYDASGNEIFPGKRLSKAMAACAIFKAYLVKNPSTKLEELQNAFPCADINSYYCENYYKDLFYLYDENSVDEHGDIALSFTADKRNGLPSLAKWDFYLKDDFLLPIENGKLKAMCVKMWRKGDFDRLIKHIKNKEFDKFITIEECL